MFKTGIQNSYPHILMLLLIIISFLLGFKGVSQNYVFYSGLTAIGVVVICKLNSLIRDLQHYAYVDYTTDLWNRRYLEIRLNEEIQRCSRTGSKLCLLMIDIDNFKSVNDSEGHASGDYLIKAMGKVLLSNTRRYDVVARWGGDEFAVVLLETDLAQAQTVAERIRANVQNAGSFNATISVGIAATEPGIDVKKLFHKADAALYRAKKDKNAVA